MNNYNFSIFNTIMKTNKFISLSVVLFFLVFIASCNNSTKTPQRTDTPTSGVASIGIDDCFAPIIDEEIDVFEALNKEATLIPTYANEKEIINLLIKDSIRLAITGRDLTDKEKAIVKNNKLQVRSQKIAVDGVALIINKQNSDSLISISTLKEIMTGKITSWKQIDKDSKLNDITVVFDNQNSSNARYIVDSINGGIMLSNNLKATQGNQDVIDYVSKTPNALGVIGVNWISSPTDTTNNSFIDKIRVMAVSKNNNATVSNSYKPYPYHLAVGEYPLIRDVYVILSDLRETLPTGFVKFVAGDTGQRIILKAGLLPATRPMRVVSVQDSF